MIINGVTTNYTSNSVNEYTTVGGTTSEYDADGNLISMTDASGTMTYSYNSLNQLTGVSSPTASWSYQYDAFGNLVSTTSNGQTTDNLFDPAGLGNLVGQYTTSGSLIASYAYGLSLVSQVTRSGANYYDFDALGSTADLTSTTGGVVATYSYLPSGGLLVGTGSVVNPFTFIGEYGVTSDGSGLLDMRHRFYNPSTGQFVSNDPLGLGGGQVNVREYVGNDSVGAIDPNGLASPGNSLGAAVAGAPNSLGTATPASTTDSVEINTGGEINPLASNNAALLAWEKAVLSHLQGPRLSSKPTPPPAKVVCKPLSESDTGYGFFSGSLGSTTMCKNPGSGGGGGGSPSTAGAYDPNSMLGPTGYGGQNFVTGSALTLYPYQINFENSPSATAPAQQVVITDTLDPNLDLSTFQLTEIDFGDTVLTIPPGSQDYQTTVSMTYNGVTFDVVISASLNYQTRELTVTFQSIDPNTQLPPNVLTGFLPPEDGTGRGEGYVSFVISPNAGLATGTQIRNVANIVFDGNTPIATDQVSDEDPSHGIDPTKQALITIDNTVPTSTVAALPATESSTSFTLSWSGSDGDGSGTAYYNVYDSEDGGPFSNLVMSTTKTSTTFTGQPGHEYSFISIATSNTGINQPAPSVGQTTTEIVTTPPPSQPAPPVLLPADDSGIKGDEITDDASPSLTGTTQADATVQLLNSSNTVVATTTANASGSYTVAIPGAPLSPGAYTFTVAASNAGGSSPASNPLTLTIVAAPATPSAPTLLPDDDSGIKGDGITDVTSPSLTGTTIAGAIVQLLDVSDNIIATTTANASGVYVIPLSSLAVRTYQYSVQTVDQYRDVSDPSPAFSLTIVAAPTTPSAPTLLPAADSGIKGDAITDDASPSLTGAAFAGATVQLLNAGGVIATVTAGTSGSYVIPIPGPLWPQIYQYSVQTIDQYGDASSPSAAFSLMIVAAPATPNAPILLPADSNGSPGGETTDVISPSLTGTTFAAATVQLLNASGAVLQTVKASSTGVYTLQVPGPLTVGSYTYKIETTDQYGDISSPSPVQTINVVSPPPPLVTAQSSYAETMKVGKGKKAKKETVIVLQFNGALNATAADNANAYDLAPVITVKASGKGKNRKPATTKLGAPVPVASASYTSSNNQVTLTPRGTLSASKPEELIVSGALLTDTLGREIDGDHSGQPGSDYIATVKGSRVTPGGIPLARLQTQPASASTVIDALLARGELAEITRSLRARHEHPARSAVTSTASTSRID